MFDNGSSGRSGLMLALGIMCAGGVMAYSGYKSACLFGNRATLRAVGSSERVVLSNHGSFEIECTAESSTQEHLDARARETLYHVLSFLDAAKVPQNEVEVVQGTTNSRCTVGVDKKELYSRSYTVIVSSKNTNFIRELARKAVAELSGHPLFAQSQVKRPVYKFTGLTEVKKPLLEEATKNAYECAREMIKGSQKKLGSLNCIRQGYVADYEDWDRRHDIEKKVKIIINADFQLLDA